MLRQTVKTGRTYKKWLTTQHNGDIKLIMITTTSQRLMRGLNIACLHDLIFRPGLANAKKV
jgi:hypothetical protein